MSKAVITDKSTLETRAGDSSARLPYEAPTLVEYGNVAKLTAGVNGTRPDAGHNNHAIIPTMG